MHRLRYLAFAGAVGLLAINCGGASPSGNPGTAGDGGDGGSGGEGGAGGKGGKGGKGGAAGMGGEGGDGGAMAGSGGDGGAMAGSGGGGKGGKGSPDASSEGGTAGSSDAGVTADGGTKPADSGTVGGKWTGIQVSGTKFVDSSGAEFIPRGICPGEWHNIESYMLNLGITEDSPGMGMTSLRKALTKAGAADDFFPTWYANVVTADDVAEWASWGTKNKMNTVRLAINYHDVSSADGVYIEAGFQWIDQFVAWCKAHKLYVILDMHAAPGAQNCEEMGDTEDGVAHLWTEPAKYRQWTINLWQHIAERYANEPYVMGFDLFDEPYSDETNGDFSNTGGIGTLEKMYEDLIKAIRKVSPHQIIIMEGTLWASGSDEFTGLEKAIQSDPQTAMSFHEYMDFNDVPVSQARLNDYIGFRTKLNRPIWHGEYGEASAASLAGTVQIDEKNGIGWNVWTYKKVGQGSAPYKIKEPSNFAAMKTFLKNKGTGTPPSDAKTIMAALAANAATKSCTADAAWVKAMFP